jgi:ribulose-phosphate 3-epimerase
MNPLTMKETLPLLDAEGVSVYHIDICDGHFAKTFLLYPKFLTYLKEITDRRLDVHLYCTTPSQYIEELVDCGADTIIIHYETVEPVEAVLQKILDHGAKAGLAFLPSTEIPDSVAQFLPLLKVVLTNTVGPAYAGQPFDSRGLNNMKKAKKLLVATHSTAELAADGAVSEERLPAFFDAGANHLVLGTNSIIKPNMNIASTMRAFKKVAEACFSSKSDEKPLRLF